MLIVLRERVTAHDVEHVVAIVRDAGMGAHVRQHGQRTVVLATGEGAERAATAAAALGEHGCVETVRPIGRPYTLACRDAQPASTRVELDDGTAIGGGGVVVIAGPCCVEDDATLIETARAAAAAGAHLLKTSTFHADPYGFQGAGPAALRWLVEARAMTGLPVISDVRMAAEVGPVSEVVDAILIGSGDMQHYDLLREAGRQPKPVVLKRGRGSTIEEWLLAAEYVLAQGNERVILCEPGVRGFDPTTDGILDVAAIPALRELTHLPVLADPSQATGRAGLVAPTARAAIAAGADGVLIDVHPRPAEARAGARRSLGFRELAELMPALARVAQSTGRAMAARPSARRAGRAHAAAASLSPALAVE